MSPALFAKCGRRIQGREKQVVFYLFEDEASLDSYLAGKIERMEASGIEGLRTRKFDVNERLTQITRGRIS